MSDNVEIEVFGELRPEWLIKLCEAMAEGYAEGWRTPTPMVFEGDPYIWNGELKMAKWTIDDFCYE